MRRHRLLAIAILLAPPAAAAEPGAGTVDWARGLVKARGGESGDLRAPSARMAGVEAERSARARARAELVTLARALPWAAGGTVATMLDAAGEARLARAIDRAIDVDVDYGSDGTVVLELGLPVEAVRWAVQGDAPTSKPPTVSALVVDARKLELAPAVGLAVEAGGERYVGPVLYFATTKAADGDARLGGQRKAGKAAALADGVLALRSGIGRDDLVAARDGAAVVAVIVGGTR